MTTRTSIPWVFALGSALLHAACGPGQESDERLDADPPRATWSEEGTSGPIAFPMIDDNIGHDTLLIQVTFDLGDGSHVMVASHVDKQNEDLRLYRYRLTANGKADMMAVSWPAYDSWTMLPTFFGDDPQATNALWLLANYGERESWGQMLVWMDGGFTDRGFMHVALPERELYDDTLHLKRRNIAPHMRYRSQGDTALFHFACDSVFVYDDEAGGLDLVLPAHRLHYTWDPQGGLTLWVDGRPRPVKRPA